MKPKNMKPNIVLIIVDQMRKDCLSSLGHPVVETPYLDMMRKEGFLFNHAYSSVPSCIPARAALMTGLSQTGHGRVGYEDGVVWDYETTLAGSFSEGGYHTQCVGKMHVHPQRNLLGFHNVLLHDGYLHHYRNYDTAAGKAWHHTDDYTQWLWQRQGYPADIHDSGMDCNAWVARPWQYEEHLHPTNWVADQSIDFLRRRDPQKPFFLCSSFVRPHPPLDPPGAYFDMYSQMDIGDPPVGDWASKEDLTNEAWDISCSKGIIGKKALKRARAAYYGLITHIDHQIGRLIQAVNEYNELNNTLFLFTSDHGDLLGDHNLFRKAMPYEGSAGIPFIIYDPGAILGCERNQVVDKPVELRDVMPTLLDAAGIGIPEKVEGKSVIPLLSDLDGPWRDYIHGEHSYGNDSNHFITNGLEKYIWFSKREEEQFFDLKNDPNELTNLIDSDITEIRQRIELCRKNLMSHLKDGDEDFTYREN